VKEIFSAKYTTEASVAYEVTVVTGSWDEVQDKIEVTVGNSIVGDGQVALVKDEVDPLVLDWLVGEELLIAALEVLTWVVVEAVLVIIQAHAL
jgi:hypothetical protein